MVGCFGVRLTLRSSLTYPSWSTRTVFAPSDRYSIVTGVVPRPMPSTTTRAPCGWLVTTSTGLTAATDGLSGPGAAPAGVGGGVAGVWGAISVASGGAVAVGAGVAAGAPLDEDAASR